MGVKSSIQEEDAFTIFCIGIITGAKTHLYITSKLFQKQG